MSVTAGTLSATEQMPGSLTTALQGSLMVDLNTPGAITFPGGGSVSLVDQPGPFVPGNGPAELAGQIYVGTDLLIAGVLRGMQFDFSAAARPLDGQGHFDPSLSALVKAGALDYESDLLGSGTSPLTGTYANHQTATPGTFTNTDGQKKLVIPFGYESLGQQGGQVFNIALHGQIVAIAEVPEPATLTLAAMAGIFLAQRIRWCESRRRRKT
ncbi:MAG: hypothetical protein K2Y37_18935 [Pirellulales bacterium]|nr:hypothetical protein [Pirellulales bacterium]